MYTKVTTIKEAELLVCKPLRHFVEVLENQSNFYKPHRSYLINLKYIKEYIKKDGGYIIMDNDATVSIANDKKEELLKHFETLYNEGKMKGFDLILTARYKIL